MKEIREILQAYHIAKAEGRKAALATVVHVEGSSYRRPGARMLVTDDGKLTGAISGGCLEGDALRKALLAINQQQNKLVTYDSTDEDDARFGVQLGCNGIVHILFEPISHQNNPNAISLLQQLISTREKAVLATLFSLNNNIQHGTSLLFREKDKRTSLPADLNKIVVDDAKESLYNEQSSLKIYHYNEQKINAFVEFIPPPVSIIIAGAGNDVQPLVDITTLLGWHTTVVDGRSSHATTQRFPKANSVFVSKPEDVLSAITLDSQTVFVLMTHNYNYDKALLKRLMQIDGVYTGILGPKKKLDRMLAELAEDGLVLDDKQLLTIHSPVGLDIGAETPEEIALSVVAEIKAVLSSGSGNFLKNKAASIHSYNTETPTN